jgi:hypothetical protein
LRLEASDLRPRSASRLLVRCGLLRFRGHEGELNFHRGAAGLAVHLRNIRHEIIRPHLGDQIIEIEDVEAPVLRALTTPTSNRSWRDAIAKPAAGHLDGARLGLIRFVDPDDISAEILLGLLEAHDLGERETECLALSLRHPYVFCCDDIKARHIGEELLGEGRVVGSLRLLKWCVVRELANAVVGRSCSSRARMSWATSSTNLLPSRRGPISTGARCVRR